MQGRTDSPLAPALRTGDGPDRQITPGGRTQSTRSGDLEDRLYFYADVERKFGHAHS